MTEVVRDRRLSPALAERILAYLVAQHSAEKRTGGDEPTVFVVDDDEEHRDSLKALFDSVGLKVNLFGSAAELLGSKLPNVVS